MEQTPYKGKANAVAPASGGSTDLPRKPFSFAKNQGS
jgi:hypothetical protein